MIQHFLFLQDWSYPMFINAYGCDQLGYEEWPWLCTRPSRQYLFSVLYHVVFIVICALVLLTLFIGVVTTTMENEGAALRQQEKVSCPNISKICCLWVSVFI